MTLWCDYLYVLDDHHAIGLYWDEKKESRWFLFTATDPIEKRGGEYHINTDAGFTYEEINPDDFYFNGRRLRFEPYPRPIRGAYAEVQ